MLEGETGQGSELAGNWETEAENWVRWVRTPGHDAYWRYRDVFFGEVVPRRSRRVLELGSGEGRVARDLSARGHLVVGVDSSPTLARYAKEAGGGPAYVIADCASLPFPDASFDLVVAYNSLMDVENMPGTVAEAARVLVPAGRLCASVTHPFADAGEFRGEGSAARFTVTRPYFGCHRFEGTFRRAGLTMTFRGWTYALEEYSKALEDAGLVTELLREPKPTVTDNSNDRGAKFPVFLYLRACKPAAAPSKLAPFTNSTAATSPPD